MFTSIETQGISVRDYKTWKAYLTKKSQLATQWVRCHQKSRRIEHLFCFLKDLEQISDPIFPGCFVWFWTESLRNGALSTPGFLNDLFLVLPISCSISVILYIRNIATYPDDTISTLNVVWKNCFIEIVQIIGYYWCNQVCNFPWEKTTLKALELSSSCKFDWGSCIVSIAEIVPRKTRTLICSRTFLCACLNLALH